MENKKTFIGLVEGPAILRGWVYGTKTGKIEFGVIIIWVQNTRDWNGVIHIYILNLD